MLGEHITDKLKSNALRQNLIRHSFFERIPRTELTRGQVAVFLGQWWHPLHYFPAFLSRLISVAPRIEMKTAIAKILYQELGEGDPRRAHEVVYVRTMTPLGFSESQVTGAAPLPATARLVAAYAAASADHLSGLGFLYGTEVADLAMVSGIGTAVRQVTGAKQLEWVDIHVAQEPEHVVRAQDSVSVEFTPAGEAEILSGAEEMWRCWIAFFDELEQRMFTADEAIAAS